MRLFHIVYASQPFGFDWSILAGILLDARRCNKRDGVTGALVCRADIYLQLLEGPQSKVEHTFGRIRQDDRHANVQVLASGPTDTRLFGDWDMLHDPAESWLWSRKEVVNGAIDEATPEQVLAIFRKLSNLARAGLAG